MKTTDVWWWVEPFVTGASILIGAATVLWQQRATARAELKLKQLKLFEQLQARLTSATSALPDAAVTAVATRANVNTWHAMPADHRQMALPINRVPAFNEVHYRAAQELTALVALLEGYDIVSEHFELFRTALSCANHDLSAAQKELFPVLLRVLPADIAGQPLPRMQNVTETDIAEMNASCGKYSEKSQVANSYVYDVRVAAQNLLLQGLFSRRVPPRVPLDKTQWVLREDDAEYLRRLKSYFTKDHPLAQENRRIQAETAKGPMPEEAPT